MNSSESDSARLFSGDFSATGQNVSTARISRKMRISIKGLARKVEESGHTSVETYLRLTTPMSSRQINEYLAYLSIYCGDLHNGVYDSISNRAAEETVELLGKLGVPAAY